MSAVGGKADMTSWYYLEGSLVHIAGLRSPVEKECRHDEISSSGLWLCAAAGRLPHRDDRDRPSTARTHLGSAPHFVVGGVSEFSPFNVVGPDGQLTGMDREIIRAAAKRLGIKQVDFKTMAFSKLGQSLLDGKIDLIANNYWLTPERERLYAFTMPYYVRGGVGSLWIEGTGPFDSAASMAGKRIAVFKGSYPETWAREHIPTATILPVDGTSAELDDTLRTGQADVVLGFYTRQKGVLLKNEGGYGGCLCRGGTHRGRLPS
jgi:ABC-type amino acid transport substrate-binding protein